MPGQGGRVGVGTCNLSFRNEHHQLIRRGPPRSEWKSLQCGDFRVNRRARKLHQRDLFHSEAHGCHIPTDVDGAPILMPSAGIQLGTGSPYVLGVSVTHAPCLCKPRHLYLFSISECPVQLQANTDSPGTEGSQVSPGEGES